ncbi:MAG: hypothetical protein IJZ47_04605 [Oscillospiraceae bacterium]|nr:hypothetical protein [Oscillospiraceae bacterium]
MSELNEKLITLKQQLSKRNSLEKMRNSLEQRRADLEVKLSDLDAAMKKEQRDVEKLESGGVVSFFYSVTGKKEQKLEKERNEADEALKNYDSVKKEYDAITENIGHYNTELDKLIERRLQLDKLLNEKKDQLKAAGADMTEIERIGAMLGRYEKQLSEIDDALVTSEAARETSGAIVELLVSAEEAAKYDLQTSHRYGGLEKYDDLRSAQGLVSKLREQLKSVRSELVGLDLSADINVEISGFLHYADRRLDGLIMDKIVFDKIQGMLDDSRNIKQKLDAVVHRLRDRQEELETDVEDIRNDYEQLLIEA